MDNTKHSQPLTRENIYNNEEQIKDKLGEFYSGTVNHRMKERDTFKNVLPSSGLWNGEAAYKTTNAVNSIPKEHTINCDKTHFLKRDHFTLYYEEMTKAINVTGKKRNTESKSK